VGLFYVYNAGMKEETRQFYLSALGIDVWEARYPLPGAAHSAVATVDRVPSPPLADDEKTAFEPAPPPGLDQIKSVLEEESEPDGGEEQAELASLPVESEGVQTDSTIALQAAVWHGKRLSVAADLGMNPGRDIQLRLGGHIMQALGEPEVTAEIMHWPAFENTALPGNDDAGFDRLVNAMAARSSCSSWLILGPESIEVLGPRLRGEGHKVVLSSELALSQLVSDGSAKRGLWEAIKKSNLHRPPGTGDGE